MRRYDEGGGGVVDDDDAAEDSVAEADATFSSAGAWSSASNRSFARTTFDWR